MIHLYNVSTLVLPLHDIIIKRTEILSEPLTEPRIASRTGVYLQYNSVLIKTHYTYGMG